MSAVTDPLHKIEEATRSIARRRCCSEVRADASDVSRIMSAPTVAHTHTLTHSHAVCVCLSLVYRPFAHSWQHLIIEKEATIRQFAQFASLHLPPLPSSPLLLCLVVPRRVSRSLSSRRRRRQSPVPARAVQMFVDKFTDVPSVLCESPSLSRVWRMPSLAGAPPPPRNCMLHVKGEI